MTRHKCFNAWFADALADLVTMQRELDDAKRGLKASTKTTDNVLLKSSVRHSVLTGDKLLRCKIKYAILRYRAESERKRLCQLVDKCETCVRLQRERIVQAWHRHVQRSLKRCAGRSDEYVRAEWRRLAGLYARFCMVDNYTIVRGGPYASYVYDETVKLIAKESR